MNWAKKDEFVEKMYRRSESINSRRYYKFGVDDFQEFCEQNGSKNITQSNVYTALDEYVNHLHKKGLKAKTISDYITAVRKFLTYVDIEIDPVKFKSKVVMPRVTQIADEPLTLDSVRILLTKGRPNPRLRALILTLLSSGMRIGEALTIRWKDVDLNQNPTRIKLRAEYTKTRVARTAYVSDEAKEALAELSHDSTSTDELVFNYSGDIWQREKEAGRTFRRLVDRVGLGEKLENHRIHKIHFHSFRKFFLTKAVDTLGDHAGHALCGHGFYMDTYYKKSEDERGADYIKLMPKLTVFIKDGLSKNEMLATFNRQFLAMAGYSNEEIAEMGDLSLLSAQQVQDFVKQKSMASLGLSGNHQKVVPLGEVKNWIGQGWEYVNTLPDSEAIIKLPMH